MYYMQCWRMRGQCAEGIGEGGEGTGRGEGMEGAGPSARVSSIEGGGGTSFRHSVPIDSTGACKVLKLVIHVASAQGGADS